MENPQLILAGQEANKFDRSEVGGKGFNLLRLYSVAKSTNLFHVPDFFIIPERYPYGSCTGEENYLYFNDRGMVRRAFERLKKPVIARSSSPLEDGVNASFAGMFSSFPNQNSYNQLVESLHSISLSACTDQVKRYAERMGIEYGLSMAFIVQEQVTDFLERGIIQLDECEGTIEFISQEGRWSHNIDYKFLDEHGSWKVWEEPHGYISEGEIHNATQCARDAKKILGLDGVVQIEFLLAPTKKPYFVQVRQLPKIEPHSVMLDIDIPKGVPYIESQVCNGVAGDVTLPAYVTFSQSGFGRILIESGYKNADERIQVFREKSKLANSHEFNNAMNFSFLRYTAGIEKEIACFEKMWATGNNLFPEYVLVCDKLDETISGMNRLTTNKRAIITCLEAQKTSHAMTTARDLGIPAIGIWGKVSNPDYFFNQIETGDFVRLKSDGRRAVAYIEKRRE